MDGYRIIKGCKKNVNWQLITIVLAVIALIVQHVYFRLQRKQYLEQQAPEIDCYYEYFALDDKCEFYIKNVGLVDCKDVWLDEKIFVIVDDEVYEGDDVPHFNYLVFEGSRTKMWDLPRDSTISIELEKLQRKAFSRLVEKFQSKIILRWLISFSNKGSTRRYQFEKYFIHVLEDRIPKELQSSVGGISILNKIKDYLASGPKQSIKIFDLTEDFELNTPTDYLINKDYSITPLSPWITLSIDEMNNAVYWIAIFEPQPSDDAKGSISHSWKCKDGTWQKWTKGKGISLWATKEEKMLFGYLTKEDAEKGRKKPSLIGLFDPNKQPLSEAYRKQREKEIREKARAKFLNKYKK